MDRPRDVLANLVDRKAGLAGVLAMLADICRENAEHIADCETWEGFTEAERAKLTRDWQSASSRMEDAEAAEDM